MSFKVSLKLDSKIFNRSDLKRVLSAVVQKSAKNFVRDVQDKMENSPHTGTVVTRARGETFRVRHQQSRRGERAAPFTRVLLNSLKTKRTGNFSALVDSDAPYTNRLIFDYGRVVVSPEDVEEARRNQNKEANAALKNLL